MTLAALAGSTRTLVITRTWAGIASLVILAVLAGILHRIIRTSGARTAPAGAGPVPFRRRGIKALVIGSDLRASTSKVQALLWTAAIFYALVFLLLWGRSVGCDGAKARTPECRAAAQVRGGFADVTRKGLQPEFYVLMGFPFAAAIAAKAMTTAKVADGTLTKDEPTEGNSGVLAGVAEVVSNDKGEADLVDFQYFAFNLLTLAFFMIEFLTKPSNGLPTLPRTLLALAGLSAATYTTKKALETDPKPPDVVVEEAASRPAETTGGAPS